MTITLHRHVLSGHRHRVELFSSLLGLPFTIVEVALASAAHEAAAFSTKNPFGQVPALDALAAYRHLRAWIARIDVPRIDAPRRTENAELASAS